MFIDLEEGIRDAFASAQLLGEEHFYTRWGWRVFTRDVPCSRCGLTGFYHARFGCRPAIPAQKAYGAK